MKVISGSCNKTDKYLEVARTLTEIFIGNPNEILGISGKKDLDIFSHKTRKRILFNICIDLSSKKSKILETDSLDGDESLDENEDPSQ